MSIKKPWGNILGSFLTSLIGNKISFKSFLMQEIC